MGQSTEAAAAAAQAEFQEADVSLRRALRELREQQSDAAAVAYAEQHGGVVPGTLRRARPCRHDPPTEDQCPNAWRARQIAERLARDVQATEAEAVARLDSLKYVAASKRDDLDAARARMRQEIDQARAAAEQTLARWRRDVQDARARAEAARQAAADAPAARQKRRAALEAEQRELAPLAAQARNEFTLAADLINATLALVRGAAPAGGVTSEHVMSSISIGFAVALVLAGAIGPYLFRVGADRLPPARKPRAKLYAVPGKRPAAALQGGETALASSSRNAPGASGGDGPALIPFLRPGDTIADWEKRQVIELTRRKVAQTEIARQVGIGRTKVQRIVRDAREAGELEPGRSRKASAAKAAAGQAAGPQESVAGA